MRQITVKQAQKWLDKLKNQNADSFKKLGTFLKKYERTDDQYQCHIKMNNLLLLNPNLVKDLNPYLEEGNKFIVNEGQEEKITKLMGYIKQHRFETFRKILAMIQQMSTKHRQVMIAPQEQNKNLIACLKNIIKGDRQLQEITDRALLSGEELIANMDLQHLKVNHQPTPQNDANNAEDDHSINISQPDDTKNITSGVGKKKQPRPPVATTQKQEYVIPGPIPPPTTSGKKWQGFPPNPNQQKKILKFIEKSLGTPIYDNIVKLIYLYQQCIIKKSEIIDMIEFIDNQDQFQFLRDTIQCRQSDRRRFGAFRPLNDNDFSMTERASPSYVVIPSSYPIRCANRTDQLKKFLNDKWISVPYGSQQTFNVRNKNTFEISLLRSQDQRYEYDLYTNKLKKANDIIQKAIQFIKQNNDEQNKQSKDQINKVIDMGVIQIVYRNANKEQKEELQWHLKSNQLETCNLFRDRINSQLKQLAVIKEVHAVKNWIDVANKNFAKSLDLKSFQFRKGQRQRLKGIVFIQELNDKIKILENGGQQKLFSIPFEDKKSFFRIFNSFECSSKTQKCLNRNLPEIKQYDIKMYKNKSVLPVMIFAFEDEQVCNHIYSLILFYIDSSSSNEGQKQRCKTFLEMVLVKFLGWKHPQKRCLSNQWDQQKFQAKIASYGDRATNPMTQEQLEQIRNLKIDKWFYTDQQPTQLPQNYDQPEEFQKKVYRFNTIQQDKDHESEYLPPKQKNSQILYVSQSFYIFLRFLYALYERIIRVGEVSQSKEKQNLFDILFYSCIKSKQGVKFEQSLNNLFGKQGYLFSSIYKVYESLVKSINSAAICQMNAQALKYSKTIQSQQMYLLLMNRFMLENNLINARMIRLNYISDSKIIYINSLYSYYKGDDQIKDQLKKRQQLVHNIQFYTLDMTGNDQIIKKRKSNQLYEQNGLEYLFDTNSYKMTTFGEKQDLLTFVGKNVNNSKMIKRQTKRVMNFMIGSATSKRVYLQKAKQMDEASTSRIKIFTH